MRRLATKDAIVVVPVVVEPVPVLNPAIIVPVDVGDVLGIVGVTLNMQYTINTTTHRILFGLNMLWRRYPLDTPHQVFSFLEFIQHSLAQAIASTILVFWIAQISTARSRDRGLFRLLSKYIIS